MKQATGLRTLLVLCIFAMMTGCSSFGSKKPDQVQVLVPNIEWWSAAESSPDSSTRNLAQVRNRMSLAVPVRYTLALSRQTEINAYATRENGKMFVVFTDGSLMAFW